jgi:hypothetical protein
MLPEASLHFPERTGHPALGATIGATEARVEQRE